jgi:hypothetical protein
LLECVEQILGVRNRGGGFADVLEAGRCGPDGEILVGRLRSSGDVGERSGFFVGLQSDAGVARSELDDEIVESRHRGTPSNAVARLRKMMSTSASQ